MKIFAVIENNLVINKILCESLSLAESLSRLKCVDVTELVCEIGDSFDEENNVFLSTKPFGGWNWDTASGAWAPPFSPPLDGNEYSWNESLTDWEKKDTELSSEDSSL